MWSRAFERLEALAHSEAGKVINNDDVVSRWGTVVNAAVRFKLQCVKQVTWCFTPSQELRLYQGDCSVTSTGKMAVILLWCGNQLPQLSVPKCRDSGV